MPKITKVTSSVGILIPTVQFGNVPLNGSATSELMVGEEVRGDCLAEMRASANAQALAIVMEQKAELDKLAREAFVLPQFDGSKKGDSLGR